MSSTAYIRYPVLFLALTLHFSCGTKGPSDAEQGTTRSESFPQWMDKDTVRMTWSQELEQKIRDADIAGRTQQMEASPGILSENDQLRVVSLRDSIAVTMLWHSVDNEEKYLTFFTFLDSLVMIRERNWTKASYDPSALEAEYYLRSDTLFYVLEKRLSLAPGEMPVKMGTIQARPSDRDREKLRQYVSSMWESVRAFRDQLEQK